MLFPSKKSKRPARLKQLLTAIEAGDRPQAVALLEKDRELVHARNEYQVEPLTYAVYRQQPELVGLLLGAGADANLTNPDGSFPLMVAVLEGQLESARLLLASGANPNRPDRYGATPLMYCAQGQASPELAHLLIEQGAQVEARDMEGDTVLMYAVTHGQKDLIPLLLKAGADPAARNFDAQTARDKCRDPEILAWLTAGRG